MNYREEVKIAEYEPINIKQKKYNRYDLTGEYAKGYLDDGREFLFDIEDYDLIKGFHWKSDNRGYILCQIKKHGKVKSIYLHRISANPPSGVSIDHINGNKFDNRKCNLREVTQTQNCYNKPLSSKNKSGVTGVFWHSKKNKWLVNISHNNQSVYIGLYEKFEDAVQARYEAEDMYYGEYSGRRSRGLSIYG